ncbi:fungal-specific transcription factor domain-containing protein [Cercophora scortea]|uniref:Fungal-specific transcription factor domain-containing protein n=1 Tax=Cercophora scortea TaxID=314031 RepID=A0AAE0IEB5_9PEZI|nr:fungal-specific transcription factor domain-containing protein [Cercophora scortea]
MSPTEMDLESGSIPDTPGSSGGRLSEPRRRNRPALSCIQCRTRKIRCDRNEPCASCVKSKIVNCTYEEARRPKPRLWRLSPAANANPGPPAPGTGQQHQHQHHHQHHQQQIKQQHQEQQHQQQPTPAAQDPFPRYALESAYRESQPHQYPGSAAGSGGGAGGAGAGAVSASALVSGARTSDATSAAISASSPAARYVNVDPAVAGAASTDITDSLLKQIRQLEQQLSEVLKRPDPPLQPAQGTPHSTRPLPLETQEKVHKTRYFGESHWMNGTKLFPLIMGLCKRIESEKNSEIYFTWQKCKKHGKSVKSQRVPTHISFDVGKSTPPEPTATRLLEAYFRTFESVYRILHGPTFWQEYDRYLENPAAASQAFVVQLQLCMAIGTCFQDDIVSLRSSATQWIYEAQIWLVSPSEKSRMNITGLQTMCLLHLARETCGVGPDLTWISAGSLLRTAMYMGLHRDPDNLPKMSVLRAEVRRRLWATILEFALQSSLDSGGPPLVSLSDFDTHHPSNFDDDQLSENEQFSPSPRQFSTFTQTTVQLALLRSFPVRLAIAQFVNHFNSASSYEETLKLNSELTNACRALSATLQPSYDPAGILPKRLSLFQLRLAEHTVHRFFLVLNHPWLWMAQNNPAYYFARKMCVETSLKLFRAFSTGSPAGASGTASQTDDFTRLATCGSGAYRAVPTQAVYTIGLELLWQAQEERSFRQSMNVDHQLDRIPAGEMDTSASGSAFGSGAAPCHDLIEAAKYSLIWVEHRIRAGEVSIRAHVFFSALMANVEALQRGESDVEVERCVLNRMAEDSNYCWHLIKEVPSLTTTPMSMSGGTPNAPSDMMNGYDDFGLGGLVSQWEKDDFIPGFNASIFNWNFNDSDYFVGS